MRNLRWILLFGLLFFSVSIVEAYWYAGFFHGGHTFNSDGLRTSNALKARAKKAGADFFVPSDHYGQLTEEERTQYLIDFSGFYKRMLLVPGVEFEINRTDGASHLLAFNAAEKFFGVPLSENLPDLITQLSDFGAETIAPHPSSISNYHNYSFDRSVTTFSGFELFNSDYISDITWYAELIRRGLDIYVTSGVDSHSSADPTDAQRWLRKTYVWMENLSQADLIAALRNGQTYAANSYAYIRKTNVVPSFSPQVVSRPNFDIQVNFSRVTKEPTAIKTYRNGVLVWDSIRNYPAGTRAISYKWQDIFTQPGKRRYFIEVSKYLVTSPITLEVNNASPLPYNPIYDCFTALETGIYVGSEPWQEGSAAAMWDENDIMPVENPSFAFAAPAKIEFFTIFHNRISAPQGYPSDELTWKLNVYNSSGAAIISEEQGMYSGLLWQTAWGKRQLTIENPGLYLVEIRDKSNTVILAQKTITVF